MFKIKIGLDWDDVVAPFNSIAINMANEKYPERFKTPLTLEDIDSWENTGRASVIHEFYGKTELYERQAVSIPQKNITIILRFLLNTYKKYHFKGKISPLLIFFYNFASIKNIQI